MLTQNKYLPFFMWSFPLLFFTYQFILRLWPGLMMQPIMAQFSIDASHFGLLTAFYYYGYASMQIPVAVLLDRFSARYIVSIFAIMCGMATFVFTYTHSWYFAILSRFFIGAGSAAGFLGISKVVSEWFPKKHYARMIGFSFSLGLMGAIYGGKPISLWIDKYHWQNVAFTLALLSIFIGCGTYLALRSPNAQQKTNLNSTPIDQTPLTLTHLTDLLKSPHIWMLALANLLMVGSLEGFADVWGVPYLMTAYHLSRDNAAFLVSFIFVGMLFGGPLLAALSKKLSHYTVIAGCGLGMALAFILILFHHTYPTWLISSLFFAIGMMCCYQVIIFAAGSELVKPHYLGVTVAFLNCINMLGGSFFHTLIGKTMDIFWTGLLNTDGLRQYNLEPYQYALSLIPICAVIGTIMVYTVGIRVRRTRGKIKVF